MEMQDKEFDQLFNSKLNDVEVEPSEQVWQGITGQLDNKKSGRSIMPYLSIAASVIVVASVSLLFFNKTAEKPEQPIKIVKMKPVKPLSATGTNAAPVATERAEDNTYSKVAAAVAVEARKKVKAGEVLLGEKVEEETTVTLPEPVMQKSEPLLSVVPVEKPAVLQSAASVSYVDLDMTAGVSQTKNTVSAPIEKIVDPVFENMRLKKRAHGLGGLINTIVAAVDKREDKLIEFTDVGDDEGSRVTGVNLGIFKIKKQ